MPITLESSLQDVRTMIGEVGTIRYSRDDLIDWLDEGSKEVAALTLSYQRRVTFANTDSPRVLMTSLREYDIDGGVGEAGLGIADSIRILHVYLDGNSLPLWTPDMVVQADARVAGGGTIRYWYQFAGNVGFVPYPSAAFVTATTWALEVVYAAYPEEWTSGASVLPSGVDELPTLFAVYRALLARRYWTDAFRMFGQYMELVQQYRALSFTQAATPRTALQQPAHAGRLDEPRRVVAMGERRPR